ncbi:hypothetical protein HYC85_026959 [Camellia sinensis]|uniref:VQ domain-containing protein n=1 Tax=Camellia sinensis TaxID=4442 RepID=A0A7J7G520_CAMSI|nr:hypothetical protein HYC85_026959 [Camellia sinensis]
MDNRNKHNDHLGVNKMGKNIRKSPLHQPNFANSARQQPQPQVYNINKNDFRNIVQQLTGSPSQEPLPRPPNNPPKPPSMRLQKIRPPPLTPINRPPIRIHPPPPPQAPPMPAAPIPYGNPFVRPPAQFGQPSPTMLPPFTPGDSVWPNTAESPISAYMRYLQNSIIDSGPRQPHPQVPGPSSGLLPNPHVPLSSPRMSGPPPLLPSPTSQFLLPSPSGFLNLLSPRSPYPLLSPGYQFPPPLTPNFAFSPMAQPGLLGPGPHPPLSPGIAFPLSPSGFFPISSPGWRVSSTSGKDLCVMRKISQLPIGRHSHCQKMIGPDLSSGEQLEGIRNFLAKLEPKLCIGLVLTILHCHLVMVNCGGRMDGWAGEGRGLLELTQPTTAPGTVQFGLPVRGAPLSNLVSHECSRELKPFTNLIEPVQFNSMDSISLFTASFHKGASGLDIASSKQFHFAESQHKEGLVQLRPPY